MTKKVQMRSLSGMSGIQPELKPEVPPAPTPAPPRSTQSRKVKKEPLVTVNIKITKAQKTWLTSTASTVRENNDNPVAPSDRVYPQHLIGVAIDLLKTSDVDWEQIHNVEDLRAALKI